MSQLSLFHIYDRVGHEGLLIRLIFDAFRENRFSEAQTIFNMLEKSRTPIRNPAIAFRIGLEMNFLNENYDQKTLMFLQTSSSILKIDVLSASNISY